MGRPHRRGGTVVTACTERHMAALSGYVAGEGQKGMTKVARS